MSTAYVYILRCADDTWYTGWTYDVTARVAAHNGHVPGGAKYTQTRRPVTLLWTHACHDKREAQRLEYRIKMLKRSDKERLIADDCAVRERVFSLLDIQRKEDV